MARLSWVNRKPPLPGTLLARMLARKPRMLVAIALANKMARAIYAMLTKQRIIEIRFCPLRHEMISATNELNR
ncbi:hypothetical protein [Kozakia baliensis]|uniref:hypothetical protein n=1 Tax=Kozakia baliensis TaxID=153496 RepID=UPI00116F8112|nr:hypothetical protein [Kozakia baliensis]GBR34940.1 hypothetical protein AA0488_2909 [Kozakia baliensis NRIC 0488]GEL64990.1 hypothetical protein KBA01_22760 [Kozakia baliensis]